MSPSCARSVGLTLGFAYASLVNPVLPAEAGRPVRRVEPLARVGISAPTAEASRLVEAVLAWVKAVIRVAVLVEAPQLVLLVRR
jgi:hypothetical protein